MLFLTLNYIELKEKPFKGTKLCAEGKELILTNLRGSYIDTFCIVKSGKVFRFFRLF